MLSARRLFFSRSFNTSNLAFTAFHKYKTERGGETPQLRIFPGFMMPLGSRAPLMDFMTAMPVVLIPAAVPVVLISPPMS